MSVIQSLLCAKNATFKLKVESLRKLKAVQVGSQNTRYVNIHKIFQRFLQLYISILLQTYECWLINDPGRTSRLSLWDAILYSVRLIRTFLLISVMHFKYFVYGPHPQVLWLLVIFLIKISSD